MNADHFRPVWIHASFRAERQAEKRAASLFEGRLDHAFHYAGVRQAELWLAVHRAHAPLFADPSFESIYRRLYAPLAEELAGRPVHVVGLGSGGGRKEAWLLEALRGAGCRLRYTPVDVSPELALLSAEVAEPLVDAELLPVVGDLSMLPELGTWLDRYPVEETRIYTAFGLTPNFRPSELLGGLREALGEQDQLLLSANLAPLAGEDAAESACRAACEAIRPQYDNPETRRWLRQVLVDWGIAQHLSEPRFEIDALEGIAGFFAYSEWLEDVSFEWEGKRFQAKRGDRLRLFFSLRFSVGRLAGALERQGLVLGEGCVTDCRQEGVWRVNKDQ
jgi:L-histidine N-alpha-methyltransferase